MIVEQLCGYVSGDEGEVNSQQNNLATRHGSSERALFKQSLDPRARSES